MLHLVKAMVFPIVMYRCERWTTENAEHRRTDAFKLWCWRRLLRVPWTARRSDQSIWKEINPEYSLEGLRRKLKLQYFGHLMQRASSLEKTLVLGKIEGQEEAATEDKVVGWHHWFNGHESEQTPGDCKGQGSLACCSPWGSKELDTTERLNSNNRHKYIYTHTHVYIYNLFQVIFPYRLLQNIEYSSLCYTVGPCWLPVLCVCVYNWITVLYTWN